MIKHAQETYSYLFK